MSFQNIYKLSSDNSPKCRSYKIVLLDATGIGKSFLITWVTKGLFASALFSTIGAFLTIVKRLTNEPRVKLHIWDTAGNDWFDSLLPIYTRSAAVILICANVPNVKLVERYIL